MCTLDFSGNKLLNPKVIVNYRRSFPYIDKTDPLSAFIIADFTRYGRITSKPCRGAHFFALQRLTRHSLHLIEDLVTFVSDKGKIDLENEIEIIDKAIEKNIKGINTTEYQSLTSIPSIKLERRNRIFFL